MVVQNKIIEAGRETIGKIKVLYRGRLKKIELHKIRFEFQ